MFLVFPQIMEKLVILKSDSLDVQTNVIYEDAKEQKVVRHLKPIRMK